MSNATAAPVAQATPSVVAIPSKNSDRTLAVVAVSGLIAFAVAVGFAAPNLTAPGTHSRFHGHNPHVHIAQNR